MASKYFRSGSIVVSETLNPAKSTLLSANWNLCGSVEHNTSLTDKREEVNNYCSPPGLFQVRVMVYVVVDPASLALKG